MRLIPFHALLAASATAGEPLISEPPTTPSSGSESDWDFGMALYAPLMGLEGNIGLAGLGPASVDVPFDKILENFDAGLSGAFEARCGRWSITADAIWLKLSASGNPAFATQFDVKQEQLTASLSAGYEIYGSESASLDLVAGGVLNYIDVDLTLQTPMLPVKSRSASSSQEWVDPFVGLRFNQRFGDRWTLFANGTIGGFDVSSQEYWQVLAGVGFRITDSTSLALAYRAVSVDYHQGGFVYDTVTSGPNLGLIIRF
ncbi:MAG: hypothetical protein V4584_06360 [Verrucomicrobiota bacterium]